MRILRDAFYSYELMTSTYMLDGWERCVVHGISMCAFCMSVGATLKYTVGYDVIDELKAQLQIA